MHIHIKHNLLRIMRELKNIKIVKIQHFHFKMKRRRPKKLMPLIKVNYLVLEPSLEIKLPGIFQSH